MNITLSGRLYRVVQTEDGEHLVITRAPEWKPSLWRVAAPGPAANILAGLTRAPVLVSGGPSLTR